MQLIDVSELQFLFNWIPISVSNVSTAKLLGPIIFISRDYSTNKDKVSRVRRWFNDINVDQSFPPFCTSGTSAVLYAHPFYRGAKIYFVLSASSSKSTKCLVLSSNWWCLHEWMQRSWGRKNWVDSRGNLDKKHFTPRDFCIIYSLSTQR